jgi:hypothetical protein
MVGTFLHMTFPDRGPVLMGGAFDRAIEDDPMSLGFGMTSHGESRGAQGNSLLMNLLGVSCRLGMCACSGIQGDHRVDSFSLRILIDPQGLMPGVVRDGRDRDRQMMFMTGFQEAIETCEREGKIGLRGLAQEEVQG